MSDKKKQARRNAGSKLIIDPKGENLHLHGKIKPTGKILVLDPFASLDEQVAPRAKQTRKPAP